MMISHQSSGRSAMFLLPGRYVFFHPLYRGQSFLKEKSLQLAISFILEMAGCRVGGHIWLIFGLFLIGFDFYSDIRVTVGLYNSCHYIFMNISILILTFPSAFMLIFLLANLIFNCKDSLSTHVKQKSGLYPNYLFGFVFCRPLTQVIIAIIETFNKEKFGRQAREGLQTLELFAQSEVCYQLLSL